MPSFRRLFLLLLLSVFLNSCTNYYMTEKNTKPEIKPIANKAKIVFYRHISYGEMDILHTYLNNNLVGQTKMKSYFIAEADPGEHYIITSFHNRSCVKVIVEAGKIYYLNVIPHIGTLKPRIEISASDPETFDEQKPEMDYLQLSSEDIDIRDKHLNEEIYKRTIAEYEKKSIKDPESYKDILNIKGYY